jgi:glycosyltransferase involved in cell wall biosynthesis
MIGIGVTTYKRPHLLEKCIEHIKRFTKSDYILYIATDTDEDRRGVAKRKNECLYFLQDCDYIFLFDDDCFPIKEDWEKKIIEIHLGTNEHHFVYNTSPFVALKSVFFQNGFMLESYEASGGVFMFLTKKVIEEVGGLYTGYDLYGFEHIGYSMRIKRKQLTSDWFISLPMFRNYLYAIDYEDENHFANESTFCTEAKARLTEKNRVLCKNEDIEIYRPIVYL